MRARYFLFGVTNLIFSSFCILSAPALAQEGSIPRNGSVNNRVGVQPRQQGEVLCYELNINPKKTVCNYLPRYESAANLQARILGPFFGGRQPGNPDEAYITVLRNGQLEFAHTDPNMIKQITEKLTDFDVLDTYIEKRKVNIEVHILQLVENAGENLGYMIGAQYAGSKKDSIKPTDRASIAPGIGSLINVNFAIGNLVNTLLDVVLNNFKSRSDIKVISSVPMSLTHGFNISVVNPYSQNTYLATTSVSSVTEQVGIRFDGQARFHENTNSKILIKDFMATVSQYVPGGSEKKDGVIEGVETFRSPTRDLELEIGCSTVIRVINVSHKAKKKSRNFIFSQQDEANDSKKDFLFIVQAVNDSIGSVPSGNCAETVVLPEKTEKK